MNLAKRKCSETFTHEHEDSTSRKKYADSLTVFHVNWIRAKSHSDRWKEELSITTHEMVWVILWFKNREGMWRQRASEATNIFDLDSEELKAYAYRQADNWSKLRDDAVCEFRKVNGNLETTFGYTATTSYT